MTGGGSGGHITPLLSLAHELKRLAPQCEVVYVGHKGDQLDSLKVRTQDFDFVSFINAGKFRRYHGESLLSHLLDIKTIALNIRDFFRFIGGIFASLRILRKIKPDVVFSKGGFVAVPVGIAACILRVPIVTHDSDTVPGLANRIIGRWASVKTSGMPAKGKTYVGIPLNDQIKPVTIDLQTQLKKELKIPPSSRLLVVGGAGNGAQRINELILAAAPALLDSNPELRIVHVTGATHQKTVQEEYAALLDEEELAKVTVLGFSNEFYKYSSAADLIINRAGATSIAEFALESKACIIIPSPFLAGGHQLKNAQELTKNDAAVVIDNEVSIDEFLAVVGELLNDSARRATLAANLHAQAVPDAATKISKILMATAERQKSG